MFNQFSHQKWHVLDERIIYLLGSYYVPHHEDDATLVSAH
jgi:hypothetical protein